MRDAGAAQRPCVRGDAFAADPDPSAARPQHAGQHLLELALSVAVDPDHAEDLPGADREVDLAQPARLVGAASREAADLQRGGIRAGSRGTTRGGEATLRSPLEP